MRRARNRRALTSVAALVAAATGSSAAWAGPTGGTVVGGQAIIQSLNQETLIKQSTSKAIINWNAFSILKNESVLFQQPSSSSIALNRVLGNQPSSILGALNSNGQVWLINPNGVLFGKSATVNAAGLLATTADIANSSFLSGNYNFNTPSANPNAGIVNYGTINTPGGSTVLAAPTVDNEGTIEARLGTVAVGAGSTFAVDFNGDNLLSFAVTSPAANAQVTNGGKLAADGGTVQITARAAGTIVDNVINTSGIVQANSVSIHDGNVILDGGNGGVNVTGTISTQGAATGTKGGTVQALGNSVTLGPTATINASGQNGGGTVLVGGNFHGAGPQPNADVVTIAQGATIEADATMDGNGGQVAVWSQESSTFNGTITAKGGPQGGNGGYVETSSAGALNVGGFVDTLAPQGLVGNWLLDPENINVTSGGSASLTSVGSFTNDPGLTDSIDPIVIGAASSNVTLQAKNLIDFQSPINMLNSGVGITAQADSITVESGAGITTQGGAITLSANDPASNHSGTGALIINAPLNTASGSNGNILLTLNGATGPFNTISLGANVTTANGTVTVSGATVLTNASTTIDTTNGGNVIGADIILTGGIDGTTAGAQALTLNSGNQPASGSPGSGSVTLNSPLGANTPLGDVTITAYGLNLGANITTAGGNVTITSPVTVTADSVTINTASGDPLGASGGNIHFVAGNANTIDASVGIGPSLTLQTGGSTSTGTVTFDSGWFVGLVQPLTNFTIQSAGNIALPNSVITTGSQYYVINNTSTGTITVNGNLTAGSGVTPPCNTGVPSCTPGSDIQLVAPNINFADPSATLTTNGTLAGGEIYLSVVPTGLSGATLNAGRGLISIAGAPLQNPVNSDDNGSGVIGCPSGATCTEGPTFLENNSSDLLSNDSGPEDSNPAHILLTQDTELTQVQYPLFVTVDSSSTTHHALTLDATSGGTNFVAFSTLGDASPLSSITVTPLATYNATLGSVGSPILPGVLSGGVSVTGAAITLGGNISTADGPVALNGPVTLASNLTIDTTVSDLTANRGADIQFLGTVDATSKGVQSLTLNAGTVGTIDFVGSVGDTTPLGPVTISAFGDDGNCEGGLCLHGDLITENGAIAIDAPTYIENNVIISSAGIGGVDTGANIVFSPNTTITAGESPFSLTVNANEGALTVGANIGNNSDPLGDVSLTGSLINQRGGITTSGDAPNFGNVTFNGPVVLGQGTTPFGLTIDTTMGGTQPGGNITFNGTVDASTPGNQWLILQGNRTPLADVQTPGSCCGNAGQATPSTDGGQITFAANVGDNVPVGEVLLTGSQINVGGDITTSGGQISAFGSMVLTKTGLVTFSTGTGPVNLFYTNNIDGTVAGQQALTINSADSVTTVLPPAMGANVPLGALTVTNPVELHGSIVTAGGAIELQDDALAFLDLTLDTTGNSQTAGASITFNGQLNAGNPTLNLSLNGGSSGVVTLDGAVGGNTGRGTIGSLNITGNAVILGGNITTNGTGVTISGASGLPTEIVLLNTITVDTSAGNGSIDFNGTVDATTVGVQGITVTTGSGFLDLGNSNPVGGSNPLGAVLLTSTNLQLFSNITTHNGAITLTGPSLIYNGFVADTTGASGTGANITINGTVNENCCAGQHEFVLNGGTTGTVSINGAIGNTLAPGSVTLTGNIIGLEANITTSNSPIMLNGATVIGANVTLDTDAVGSSGGDIDFNGTLDDLAAHAHSLTLTAGTGGNVNFNGRVGVDNNDIGVSPGDVTITSAQNVNLDMPFGTNGDGFSAKSLTVSGVTGDFDVSHYISTFNSSHSGGAISIDVGGNVDIDANINTSSGVSGGNGGAVTITAGGTVSVAACCTVVSFGTTGSGFEQIPNTVGIFTGGYSPTTLSQSAGNGGNIIISGTSINLPLGLSSEGGHAVVAGSTAKGGDGGLITLTATAGNVSIGNPTANGPLELLTSTGGNSLGGAGGNGGAVSITASGQIIATRLLSPGGSTHAATGAGTGGAITLVSNATSGAAIVLYGNAESAQDDPAPLQTINASGGETGVTYGSSPFFFTLGSFTGTGGAISIGSSSTGHMLKGTSFIQLVDNSAVSAHEGGSTVFIFTSNANTNIYGSIEGTNPGAEALRVINEGAGEVSISGDIGGSIPLGFVSLGGTPVVIADTITTEPGILKLNGDIASYAGQVFVNGPVSLAADTTITTNGANITFGNITAAPVDGAHSLTLNAGVSGGAVSLNGDLGDTTPLQNVSITGSTIDLGGNITTTGSVTVSGATVLQSNLSIDTTAGGSAVGAPVTFGGSLDDSVAQTHSLTIVAGTGDVDFEGQVGGAAILGDVSITSANNVNMTFPYAASPYGFQVKSLTIEGAGGAAGANNVSFAGDISTINSGNGGNVTIVASGFVADGGSIFAMSVGASNSGATGGNGGTVSIKAGGNVSIGTSVGPVQTFVVDGFREGMLPSVSIDTFGSAGTASAGNGGNISITSGGNIKLPGGIYADGQGEVNVNTAVNGGNGGNITLTALNGSVSIGNYDTNGNLTSGQIIGLAPYGGASTFGNGGNGGNVVIQAQTISVPFIWAYGGDSLSSTATGGNGGNIALIATANNGAAVTLYGGSTAPTTAAPLFVTLNSSGGTSGTTQVSEADQIYTGGTTTGHGGNITIGRDAQGDALNGGSFIQLVDDTIASGLSGGPTVSIAALGAVGHGGTVILNGPIQGNAGTENLWLFADNGSVTIGGAVTALNEVALGCCGGSTSDGSGPANPTVDPSGSTGGVITFDGSVTVTDIVDQRLFAAPTLTTTSTIYLGPVTATNVESAHDLAGDGAATEFAQGATLSGSFDNPTGPLYLAGTLKFLAGFDPGSNSGCSGECFKLGGTVTLIGNTIVDASAVNDPISFLGAVVPNSNGAESFTWLAGTGAITVTSGATFGAAGASLSNLTLQGSTIDLNNGGTTTAGAQTYNGAVVLTANTILTSTGAGNITFDKTVDAETAGGESLTVNTAGMTIFDGTVGTTALASLDVTGTAGLNGGSVTTTGAQTYGGAVTLGADNDLTGTVVTFDSTVGGARNLTVTGNGVFDNTVNIASLDVTGTVSLNGGAVTTTGAQGYGGAVTLGTDNDLTGTAVTFGSTISGARNLTVTGNGVFDNAVNIASLGVTGTADLNGGSVTTTGAQTYGGAVTLGAGTTLASSGTGNISFNSTLDGAQNLGIATGGTVTFAGNVGAGTPLAAVQLTAPTIVADGTFAATSISDQSTSSDLTFNGFVKVGTLAMVENPTATSLNLLDGATVSTDFESNGAALTMAGTFTFTSSFTGSLTIDNPIILANTGAVLNGSATDKPVVIEAAIDGTTVGGQTFAVIAGNNPVTITAPLGAATGLGAVTIDAASVSLGANITANGLAVVAPVTLTAPVTVNSGSGAVAFASTVDGDFGLTVNNTGVTGFAGAVGGTTPLASLTENGGNTVFVGNSVTTVGNQSYGAVIADGNLALTAQTGSSIAIGAVTALGGGNVAVVADSVTLNGNWTGNGARSLHPFTAGSSVATDINVPSPASSFDLDTTELGYIANGCTVAAGCGVTIGVLANPLTADDFGSFKFDAALNLVGNPIHIDPLNMAANSGNLTLNSGTGPSDGAINLGAGDDLVISAGSSAVTGTVNGQSGNAAAQFVTVIMNGPGPFTTNGVTDGSTGSSIVSPIVSTTSPTNSAAQANTTIQNQNAQNTQNLNQNNAPQFTNQPQNNPLSQNDFTNSTTEQSTGASAFDSGASMFIAISPTAPTDLSASNGANGSDSIVIAYANPAPVKAAANAEASRPQVVHALGAYLNQMLTPTVPRNGVPGISFGYSLSGNSALW